jgi:outer membrane protein OmpA-like peptidoglycan-associated protein
MKPTPRAVIKCLSLIGLLGITAAAADQEHNEVMSQLRNINQNLEQQQAYEQQRDQKQAQQQQQAQFQQREDALFQLQVDILRAELQQELDKRKQQNLDAPL